MVVIIVAVVGALAGLIPVVASLRSTRIRRLERQSAVYATLPQGQAHKALADAMDLNAMGILLAERRRPGKNLIRLSVFLLASGAYFFGAARVAARYPDGFIDMNFGVAWLDDDQTSIVFLSVVSLCLILIATVVTVIAVVVTISTESPHHALQVELRKPGARATKEQSQSQPPLPPAIGSRNPAKPKGMLRRWWSS